MHKAILAGLLGAAVTGLALPARAQSSFAATLSGAQQTPPNASTATGTATLILSAAQDRLTYTITLVGLDLDGLQTPADATDDVTNLHIHGAAPGVAGPVRFGMIAPGDDADDIVINGAAGTITGSWEETDALFFGGTLSTYLADLLAGNLYINVHTVAFPPGEIRGQILSNCDLASIGEMTIDTTVTLQGCRQAAIGPDVTMTITADVWVSAGVRVTLRNGVVVQRNAELVVGVCGQNLCAEALSPLDVSCMPCVSDICSVDPFCCATAWDGQCVGEVGSICGLTCPP